MMIKKLLPYFKFNDEKQQYELIKNSNVIVMILDNGSFEVNLLYEKDPDYRWNYGRYSGHNSLELALDKAIDLNYRLKTGSLIPKKGRDVA